MPDLIEKVVNFSTTNVTVTTTTETAIISTGALTLPVGTAKIVIRAWAQLTSGAGTTAVTARIRRGSTTAGALVGEANSEAIKTAAGSTEPFFIMVTDDRANEASVEYVLTLTQTGATANGTVLQAFIEAECLNG
jgi:hypothetical protein